MRDEEKENWLPVKGYEDFYEVSDLGNIRTIERYITLPTHSYLKKSKFLTQYEDGRGYLHVKLYNGKGKPKSVTSHRIVASTFIPNLQDKPQINHIDGNKLNNKLENLEWCTHEENMFHVRTMNQRRSSIEGENNISSKLTKNQVLEIREKYSKGGITMTKLGELYNTKYTNISSIINRKTWKYA